MAATVLLTDERTFFDVPLKATKRGFNIPRPPVLRTLLNGADNANDKEVDARGATFTWTPKTYYTGTVVYKPVGKAGFTKTVTAIKQVTAPEWNDAMRLWKHFLQNNAENWTNTHHAVCQNMVNSTLVSHATTVVTKPPVTLPTVATPLPIPIQNGPITIPAWDPTDPDIAHDLFDIPQDNPAFLEDKETFNILDEAWRQAMAGNDSRHVLIYGDTSTGKTEHPKIWCARNGVLWCRIDCGAFGEIYDVTGPIKAVANPAGGSYTEWVKGKTIRAFADPRPVVLQFDEVNRISDVKAMNVLFPFLDSSRQSYFDDNQSWMKSNGVKLIVATMNGDTRGDDIGEYVGTQPLDQAFISRFPIRRQLRYPTADRLAEILQARNQGVLPDQTIMTVAEIATELVALNKFVPNFRELFAAIDFLKGGIDLFHALKWTVGGIYKNDGTAASDYVSFKAVLTGKNINTDE
jgi:hypothetical protein